jgi:hypothetical protein
MAQVVTRTFIDDIDGSEAERTFTFAVDGVAYEIDLSSANIAEFKAAVGGFVESARKAKAGKGAAAVRKRGSATAGPSRKQTAAIREWARNNGLNVSGRGRISAEVISAFNAAHEQQSVTVG